MMRVFRLDFQDENGITVELDAFDRNGTFVGKVTKLHYFRSYGHSLNII